MGEEEERMQLKETEIANETRRYKTEQQMCGKADGEAGEEWGNRSERKAIIFTF